jgi:hypothetical protein
MTVATTRQAALALGLASYDTGKKCFHGHRSPRRTSDGKCRSCDRAQKAKAGVRRREALEQGAKVYQAVHPCKACGSRERDVKTRECVECRKSAKRKQRQVKKQHSYESGDRWERREQELRRKFQSRLW